MRIPRVFFKVGLVAIGAVSVLTGPTNWALAQSAVGSRPSPSTARGAAANAAKANEDNAESNARYGGSVEELSAAQAIAKLERQRLKRESSLSRGKVKDLISYEYVLAGPDEEALMQEAMIRALKSSASRVYFGEEILLGRDLLEPYLNVYGDRFVVHREIAGRKLLAGGDRQLHIKLGVDAGRLFEDLNEKHFIAKPKIRPIIAVLLEETKAGQPTGNSRGRAMLEDALIKNEMRVESARVPAPFLAVNGTRDPETLQKTVEEVQRWNIDVMVTGALEITPREDQVILYDQVFFLQGRLTLNLVRADTGEVMRSITDRKSSWGLSAENAMQSLLESIIPDNGAKLVEGFLTDWSNIMLDKGDYQLLVRGVDPALLASITGTIETLSPEIKTYVKAFYGDVAVVNIKFPSAQPGQFERFLVKSKAPQFKIQVKDERHIIVDVL